MTASGHPRLRRAIHTAPTVAGAVIAACAALVLVGWALDVETLKRLIPTLRTPMNPTTAICFLLAAAALWLVRGASAQDEAGGERLLTDVAVRAIGVALACVGAIVLASHFASGVPRVDQLMFRARLRGNLMAPNTAAAFTVVGVAFLLFELRTARRGIHPAQFGVLAAGCIALLGVIGYAFRVGALYGIGAYQPMALNTAFCFVLLTVGLLCARPRRQPIATILDDSLGGTTARRLLPAAFLLPLLLGYLRLLGERRGWFSSDFGVTLFVLSLIVVFNTLIWWNAQIQRRTDQRRRLTEDALRLSEERHRAVMEQAAEGIYLVDLETKQIIDSNAALDRLLGYERGEARTRKVYDFVHDTPEHVNERMRVLAEAAEPLHGERVYRRKDGSSVEVESSAGLISFAGRKVACTVVHDITQRKQMERQLHEVMRAEQEAHKKLKVTQSALVQSEKLAGLGQMVAGVAHEINNPLAFVSNNVAVLQRDVKALGRLLALYRQADDLIAERNAELIAEIRDLAEAMDLGYTLKNLDDMLVRSRDGLKRIQQIVKDLRDFARLDAADLQEVDLNAGIDSTVGIVRGLAKKKQVAVELELAARLPRVRCFPAKINQVVMNLVTNAIDACGTGGKVVVRTASDGDGGVRLEVSDNGSGIDPAVAQRIFDPFFTTKPIGQGTGLGLSISYGIVQDHGGEIAVRSDLGRGSTFAVTLPIDGQARGDR